VELKSEIFQAIKEKFNIDREIIVQQPYEDDWLDVDEESADDLVNFGKLRFLIKTGMSM
jgi:hypothetical protein